MDKILVIATYDSFVKSGIKLAQRLCDDIDIAIQHTKKNQLSQRQIQESHLDKFRHVDYRTLKDSDFDRYSVIIIAAGNANSRTFAKRFMQIYAGKIARPITIAIFPGLIWGQAESILSRIHFDIILANSEYDKNITKNLINQYKLPTRVINYGLINIEKNQRTIHNHNSIFFIDQVKIPETKQERQFTLNKLIELAQKRPDYHVYLKRRVINNELTVHKDKHSYSELLSKYPTLPENFSLFDGSIDEAYRIMGTCLSFSSSVSIEALHYDIPSFVLSDLGVNDKLYNYPFVGSGMFISIDELIQNRGIRPSIQQDWFTQHVFFDEQRDSHLRSIITEIKLSMQELIVPETLFGGSFRFTLTRKTIFRKLRKFIVSPKLFFIDSKLFKWINSICKSKT